MGSIVKNIGNVVDLESYASTDVSLMVSKSFGRSFGDPNDYVEMHVYSPNNSIISSNYSFTGYGIPGTIQGTNKSSYLTFSPEVDLYNLGYAVGTFNVQYNILRNRINSKALPSFFISTISSDRTEIRVISNVISNSDLEVSAIQFISDLQSSSYFKDFLLDFGSNVFYKAVNLALDRNSNPYSLLIKLYQPLPSTVNINDSFWIVEELSDSYTYAVQLFSDPVTGSSLTIGSPNFDINVNSSQIRSSDYINYQELLSTTDPSTYHLILDKLNQNNVTLNIDYSDYSNFVHFSSAKQRLLNFVYKLQQIENYGAQISSISSSFVSPSVSSSINVLQNNISTIISKFDGYDHYLYFNSESNSWPKSGSVAPYSLYPTNSTTAANWLGYDDSFNSDYGGMLFSASFYDSENPNNLLYSIPEYLRIDPANKSYELFVEMLGQHFDYIWTYIKAFGDIYKTNNSLNKGISKDLVYYMLKSFGIKLYNNVDKQDLYQYLIGVTNSGSYSYPTNSFETLITSSVVTIPGQDNVKEIFKRIYHNVPYLLKTKGTEASLRALSTAFGIPSTIMRFNEYGGMDKQYDTIQYSYDRFSYALNTEGSGSVSISWDKLNLNDVTSQQSSFADTIEFRFKPDSDVSNLSQQTLLEISNGVTQSLVSVNLQYSSSNNIPYGNITFKINNGSGSLASSSPITLPIFYTGSNNDTSWWNIMIRRRNQSFSLENDLIDYDIQFVTDSDSSLVNVGSYSSSGSGDQYYDVFVKNVINGKIGHQGSSSFFVSQSLSSSYNGSWDTSATVYIGGRSSVFSGLIHEVRFWNYPIYQSAFNYHTLNPQSIEGINSGSFYNNLAGWFPLGNDLLTYNHFLTSSVNSVHPNQLASFPSASFLNFGNLNNYIPIEETYYADTPIAGNLSPISDKIRIQDIDMTGSVLSPYIRLEEPLDFPLTKDLHFIDASFSPQSEVDEDIIASLGSTFNIDNYIGNPQEETSDIYSDLDELSEFYFQKYLSKYNYKDYIRLIKYFDNALFKMFDDFVAARADLQTGITIRPTLLERSKIKRFHPDVYTYYNYTASIDCSLINSIFYNNELSGSVIDVDDYFEVANKNPYLHSNQNGGIFKGSDFDVTLNNVQLNVTSSYRRKIDTNGVLLIPVELQDSNYSYKRHIISRYNGSKTISKNLNFYSSKSYSGSTLIWDGDKSYGKTAAIDSNTTKFGWVKTIPSSSLNFFDKTTIILKYLVDPSGSLTELSRHNYNLFEVQNTFRSHEKVVVSLSDIIKPSNQTTLDGDKNIFEGGFSYWPIVYRESAEQLHYRYLTSIITTQSISLTAIQTKLWQFNTKNINFPSPYKNIDDDTSQGDYLLTYGTDVLSSGQFSLPHYFPFSSWSYASVPGLKEVGSVTLTNGNGGSFPFTTDILSDIDQFVYPINHNYFNLSGFVSSNDSFSQYVLLNDGSYAYKVPRTSNYNVSVDVPFNMSINDTTDGQTVLKVLAVLERNTGANAQGQWTYVDSSTFSYVEAPNVAQHGWTNNKSLILLDLDSWQGGSTDYPIKVMCSINSNVNLNANDYLRLSFFIIRLRNFLPANGVDRAKISFENKFSGLTSNAQSGRMIITDSVNQTSVLTSDGFYTQNSLFTIGGINSNIITFSDSASILYGKIIFDQAAVSSSTSYLYSPIDYPFTFEVGDIVRLNSFYVNNPTYYRVNQVIPPITGSDNVTVISDLQLVLDRSVVNSTSISSNFAIFRRLPDETSVILNFIKNPGGTSQALLIPYDIDVNFKSNVANVATQISQQIAGLNV